MRETQVYFAELIIWRLSIRTRKVKKSTPETCCEEAGVFTAACDEERPLRVLEYETLLKSIPARRCDSYPREHLLYPFFSLALFLSLKGKFLPIPFQFGEWDKNSARDRRRLEIQLLVSGSTAPAHSLLGMTWSTLKSGWKQELWLKQVRTSS